jgi:PAS domain S-box-containing protein
MTLIEAKKYINVLAVEDDEDDFFILEETFKDIPFQKKVTCAANYMKAKELLSQSHYDVCLVDYRLGAQTGIEVISAMSREFPLTPCILVTSLKEEKIDEEALKSGAYDYIIKGQYTADTLSRSIRYTLEKAKNLQSLKQSENRFRNLFENSPAYIFIVDSQKTIIDANYYFLNKFRIAEDDIIGKKIFDQLDKELNTAPNEDRTGPFVEEIQDFNNKELHFIFNNVKVICEVIISPIDNDLTIFQVLLNDITELKTKKDKERILEKQALTGRVARVIAHEIKNPLTNIKLSLSELKLILNDQPAETLNEDPNMFLNIIERNSDRINNLLNDLLDATRMDTLNIEDHFLKDIIEDTLKLVIDRANFKSVAINKAYHQNPKISGDKDKLVIAFTNILVNAIEAVPANSGVITLDLDTKNEIASLRISDNGYGIPKENIARLFEPFFTSKKEGTGLGLTATYNIINKHDGNIEVSSRPDRGTTFMISLPVCA